MTRDSGIGYADSDFTKDVDKRISLAGYLFTIGGCTINYGGWVYGHYITYAFKEAILSRDLVGKVYGDL